MVQPKRIAIFIDSLGGGGAEKVMLTLAQGMIEQRHSVDFLLLEPRIEYQPSADFGVHVLYQDIDHRQSTSRRLLAKTAADMTKLYQSVVQRDGEFDLVLANLDPSCRVVEKMAIPNVYYVLHNAMEQELKREAKLGPIKYWRKRREKNTYNNKKLVAVSKGVAAEAQSGRFIMPASTTTIYNPTDITKVSALAKEPNPDIPTFPYLIHAGRVVKQKRHDILFKALSQVPDIKLVLLCKYAKKARKLAQKYGVADRIITPGFQANPYNWFANARLLVSSSDFEGLGMNLIDALLCGTPVISTDCPYGPNEILTGELADYLVPVNDHKALADKINQALASPPPVDIATLRDKFSLEQAVHNYLALCG